MKLNPHQFIQLILNTLPVSTRDLTFCPHRDAFAAFVPLPDPTTGLYWICVCCRECATHAMDGTAGAAHQPGATGALTDAVGAVICTRCGKWITWMDPESPQRGLCTCPTA